jgi:hypothetical protein
MSRVTVRDEVALLEPVFARAGDPFVLAATPTAEQFIDFWMGKGS